MRASIRAWLQATVFLLGTVASVVSAADGVYAGAAVGGAVPANRDFGPASVGHGFLGYRFDRIQVQYGVLDPGRFEDADARIETAGLLLLVSATLVRSEIDVMLGLGAYRWDAEAYFAGRKVGEDSDTSLAISLSAEASLFKRLRGFVNWQHLQDVSGTDIDSLQVGFKFALSGADAR